MRGSNQKYSAMSFEAIGQEMGISHQAVILLYQRAMRKMARRAYSVEMLREYAEYNRALRARSIECRLNLYSYTVVDWKELCDSNSV